MDVCDDADYSQMLKGYSNEAKAVGVPAITSAGTCCITTFSRSNLSPGRFGCSMVHLCSSEAVILKSAFSERVNAFRGHATAGNMPSA